jgi:hypothetical protein
MRRRLGTRTRPSSTAYPAGSTWSRISPYSSSAVRMAGRDKGASFGNLTASPIAGLLWTAISPRVAFGYLASWMVLALVGLLATRRGLTERQSRAG